MRDGEPGLVDHLVAVQQQVEVERPRAVLPRDADTAEALLDGMLAIEQEAGRERRADERWGPRTLDLDLLLYGDARIASPRLTVPHPRMWDRAFVLRPLADVAPERWEFWQGRKSRLHDRLRYRLDGGAWVRERLAP